MQSSKKPLRKPFQTNTKFLCKTRKAASDLFTSDKKYSTKFSSNLDAQDKNISSFATYYDEDPDKIKTSNKVITNIEI